MDRLREALSRHGALAPRALAERIFDDVDAFRGADPPRDDMTVLVLRS